MLDGCVPWPEEAARRYREVNAWTGETLATLIERSVRRFPNRVALTHGDEKITYASLNDQVGRIASGFQDDGLVSGDRVLVQLPNIPELLIVCLALFRLGVNPVLVLPQYRSNEITYICEHVGAVGYVVSASGGFDYVGLGRELLADSPTLRRVYVANTRPGSDLSDPGVVALSTVAAAPRPHPVPDPDEVAFFLLSGGTTAAPKLIPRTHNDYLCQLRAAIDVIGLTSADVYLAALPAAFNFTWGCPGILGTLRVGGTVVLCTEPDPVAAMRLVASDGATVVSLVPSLAQLWADERATLEVDTSSLRVIQVGGARLPRALAERLMTGFEAQLQQVYGMSEGLLSVTRLDDPKEAVLSTQGRPLSDLDEIRIVDDDGVELPAGRFGELETRGPYTLNGYYRATEHNAVAFTKDGFYRTGDLARLTTDGRLEVTGRRKDVVNRGGMKISAVELEGHLIEYDGVTAVAVVPVPDPVLGQQAGVCLTFEGERPPTLSELKRHCRARGLAEYKLPDRVEVMTSLPMTPLGKIDKKTLERHFTAGAEHESNGDSI